MHASHAKTLCSLVFYLQQHPLQLFGDVIPTMPIKHTACKSRWRCDACNCVLLVITCTLRENESDQHMDAVSRACTHTCRFPKQRDRAC